MTKKNFHNRKFANLSEHTACNKTKLMTKYENSIFLYKNKIKSFDYNF